MEFTGRREPSSFQHLSAGKQGAHPGLALQAGPNVGRLRSRVFGGAGFGILSGQAGRGDKVDRPGHRISFLKRDFAGIECQGQKLRRGILGNRHRNIGQPSGGPRGTMDGWPISNPAGLLETTGGVNRAAFRSGAPHFNRKRYCPLIYFRRLGHGVLTYAKLTPSRVRWRVFHRL